MSIATTTRPSPSSRQAGRPTGPLTPLVGVGVSQLAGGFVGGATGPYIVLLALHLGMSPSSLGWIASAFGAGLLLVAATGEWLLRLGATRVLRVASILQLLACVGFALTSNLQLVMVAAALSGLGGAGFVVATSTLMRGSTSRMSLVTAIASAAGLAAPPAIGALELIGVPGELALLVPIPALLVLILVPVRVTVPEAAPAVTNDSSQHTGTHWNAVAVAWSAMLLAVAAEFCFFIWGVARLLDSGLTPGFAAVLGVAFPLGMVAGRTVGARLRPATADQARHRLRWAAAITATATIPVVLGSGPAWVAAGLLIAGLGLSLMYPLTLSLLIAVPGLLLRRAAAIGASASGTAILVAPLALAALADVVALRWAFLLPLPLLVLLALTTVMPARPRFVKAGL